MGTKHGELFNRLTADFHKDDVKSRPGGNGKTLWYLTARTCMNRLDEVLGPENWEDAYYESKGVLFCKLTITLPDGSKVSKCDAGGFKEMTAGGKADDENTDKTGPTDAFKRVCAKFGIGRSLYGDGMVSFEEGQTNHPLAQERSPARPRTEDPSAGDYTEPIRQERRQPDPPRQQQAPASNESQGPDRPPTNGGALFSWVKKQEQIHEYPILDKLVSWCKQKPREWGWDFRQFDAEKVKAAHWQAIQIIAKIHDQSPATPDEDQSQAQSEPVSSAPKPPLNLSPRDPLLTDKQDILRSVIQLTFSTLQRKGSEREVCERIDYIASECYSGQIVGNLRECKDAGLIRAVKAAAASELQSLRSMGAA